MGRLSKENKFCETKWGNTTDKFMTHVALFSDNKLDRMIAGAIEYAPKKAAVASRRQITTVLQVLMAMSTEVDSD